MIPPHGGQLVQQIIKDKEERNYWEKKSKELITIVLEEEQIKEVKNIARGLYSPLNGYMRKGDFESVAESMKLENGTVWPIPIALDIPDTLAKQVHIGRRIALRDSMKTLTAILVVEDKYKFNRKETAKKVFGTTDTKHPGVEELMTIHKNLVGGDILLIDNTKNTFNNYNLEPIETRILFTEKGWKTVVGFQTRNAPHRAHEYLQKCALEIVDGLFINPVIGKKKDGDYTDEAIINSYNTLIENYFNKNKVVLSILPLKMRYAGPREAVMHAIIRKNFGCTHFVVGRDHAGVSDYYDPYAAQNIFDKIPDLGIKILKYEDAFYCEVCNNMATSKTCSHNDKFKIKPSGTMIRDKIRSKERIPEEIVRPEVMKVLQEMKEVFV
ncbi:MAG: sulfate adenylyltransferase [Patescibacteria group bacterium]|nr:sulfate adenylyltransferase [Patescibacteria group bacterium]